MLSYNLNLIMFLSFHILIARYLTEQIFYNLGLWVWGGENFELSFKVILFKTRYETGLLQIKSYFLRHAIVLSMGVPTNGQD